MIYRKHMSRAETTTEEADDRCKTRPPSAGSTQKAEDDKDTCKHRCHILTTRSRTHAEHSEEGEDIWDNYNEVGNSKAEHRGEVLPQRSITRAVAANLRHRVLEEDVDADNNHKDTAHKAQDVAILLDLRLHHRVEEVGDNRHKSRPDPKQYRLWWSCSACAEYTTPPPDRQ